MLIGPIFQTLTRLIMLKNYFKIALRNLLKHKVFSFINLFGLTVGLACCLLISIYIIDELSYDRYHENADRIYRVTRNFIDRDGSTTLHLGHVAPPFGPLIANDFPDIEAVTRMLNTTVTLRYEDNVFTEENAFFAEPNIFNIFTIPVVAGDPTTALENPFSVMLNETMAKKYFGDEDPIGKQLLVNGQMNASVTGIFKDFPDNSHMHPDMLVAFSTLNVPEIYGEEGLRTNWGNNSFSTYILLPEGYPAENIEAQFPDFLDRHMGSAAAANNARMPSEWTTLFLDKMTDIHLYSHLDSEIEENGDIKRIYIFSGIAIFILLIAGINYMNLSTARSATRAKEIGIRKVAGAHRRELMGQFLSESVLMTFLAMLLAIGLAWLCLPVLESLTDKTLTLRSFFDHWYFPVALLGLTALVGLMAGVYPAVFMSSFQPVRVLKGVFKVGGGNVALRKVLVVAQFSISIILISSTGIVFQQLRYMQQKALGYDREHVITMPYQEDLTERYDAFRNELLSNPNIKAVTRSTRIPTGRLLDSWGSASAEVGDSIIQSNVSLKSVAIDYDFVDVYDMDLATGRNFSRSYSTDDSTAFIINETAARAIGWKTNEEAIGKSFQYGSRQGTLVGIFKDFHFESLHQTIQPMIFMLPDNPNWFGNMSIKLTGQNMGATLSHVEKTWNQFLPQFPYQYTFLEENYDQLYEAENRQGQLFTIFSGIAIFVACLGLFGLAAFATSQRTKEIGIRKVLGASVPSVVMLLSKDFLRLVLIGLIIATPIAWLAMSSWLADFAYRINIQWWVFLVAGFLAILVALVTVSFQSIKAAVANPVNSLRSE